jgi:hypothetical protein
MTCSSCNHLITSRNCLERRGQYVCSRACAMRLGGEGWELQSKTITVEREEDYAPHERRGQVWVKRNDCCPHGHPKTEQNTIVGKDGKRKCRRCNCERMRRNYARRKAKAAMMESKNA